MNKISWSLIVIWGALSLAAGAGAVPASKNPAASPGTFDSLVDDFVFGALALSPSTATSDGYHEHNIYVESVGAIYQYNRFGPLRAGCHRPPM